MLKELEVSSVPGFRSVSLRRCVGYSQLGGSFNDVWILSHTFTPSFVEKYFFHGSDRN